MKGLHEAVLISEIDLSPQQWRSLPLESIRCYVYETAKLLNFMVEYSDVQLAQMVREMSQEGNMTQAMIKRWHIELLDILRAYGPHSNLFQDDNRLLLRSCVRSILMLQAISQ